MGGNAAAALEEVGVVTALPPLDGLLTVYRFLKALKAVGSAPWRMCYGKAPSNAQ